MKVTFTDCRIAAGSHYTTLKQIFFFSKVFYVQKQGKLRKSWQLCSHFSTGSDTLQVLLKCFFEL